MLSRLRLEHHHYHPQPPRLYYRHPGAQPAPLTSSQRKTMSPRCSACGARDDKIRHSMPGNARMFFYLSTC